MLLSNSNEDKHKKAHLKSYYGKKLKCIEILEDAGFNHEIESLSAIKDAKSLGRLLIRSKVLDFKDWPHERFPLD